MKRILFCLFAFTLFTACTDDEEEAQEKVEQKVSYHYTFEGNCNDVSSSRKDGFCTDGTTYVPGVTPNTQALRFNRTKDSKLIIPSPIIDSKEMSISFWVKNLSDGHIFHMTSRINEKEPMFTLMMINGHLKFVITRYNNWYVYNDIKPFSHPSLDDNEWHHIVILSDFEKTAFSTITNHLYVDGKHVDSLTEGANHFSENGYGESSYLTGVKFIMGGTLEMGHDIYKGNNMIIDNFRVYQDYTLQDIEIKSLYRNKK